ncbi:MULTISPECIES: polysaccharide biosynthesis protein [Bacillus]|uniref:Cell division protein n=2 Tax=Bacillus infantis TaxID=324767 RepID=U5LEM0_9BACI|nr:MULTISPECIES: polysaccharide biosynthesis protein [Bacillus]AGX05895.1 cell division protein [Bacillus infantis NRRL B-14911]EAR64713.1 transporter involved in the export of O-antigen and teichoic acid [Bacillus sp. NRRL B-14911]MCP1160155.1 polysaccharide biosynthesis protein [Bacillus infantis]PLR72972.1 polysaccharide biosynthesis protein [Bacillus sp. UMB0728]TYS57478.1 polysaccharide biosynthesis protein [Bacillus infantis]
MSSKLLRGTFILTLGTIISKVLGLFYVIPFYRIVGDHGSALYQYSYVPYTIFISIATAGIPLAVSKFIAKYNALEEYAVGRKLFKSGLVVMLCSGIFSFLILYFSAPVLAELFIPDSDLDSSVSDVITVIRAVSFALIVVPFMSLIRGFFQGHQSMGPSAVSQVVEQIVRIVFLLAGAYIVLNWMGGSLVKAVSVATFAAFIGAIGSLAVLFWYWYKRKSHLDDLLLQDKGTMDISLKDMYKEILIYAAPFIFVGLANPLFQIIDQLTFNRAMAEIGLAGQAESSLAVLNFQAHKLVIIPVSLATAFSLTLVPAITKAFTDNDRMSLNKQLNQTFQVLLFLTLPAAAGLSLLAEPVFTVFYEHKELGTEVLRTYAPVAMLFSLFSVTAAILQGINEQRFTILSLLVGLLVKLSLNIPLIKLMETQGAVLATTLGYTAAILINLYVIRTYAEYPFRLVVRRSLLIILFTAFMFAGTAVSYKLLTLFLSPASTIQSLIIIFICAGIGAAIYFYLAFRTRLVYFLFGQRVEKIKQKLRLRF